MKQIDVIVDKIPADYPGDMIDLKTNTMYVARERTPIEKVESLEKSCNELLEEIDVWKSLSNPDPKKWKIW